MVKGVFGIKITSLRQPDDPFLWATGFASASLMRAVAFSDKVRTPGFCVQDLLYGTNPFKKYSTNILSIPKKCLLYKC